jgi:D-lactate dehydrogenase
MPVVSFFDTKPYDRAFMQQAADVSVEWRFHEFRLNAETARVAEGADAVCLFVNDKADRACLEVLKNVGVRAVILRSAGFNHVDLDAARELGLAVTRVPAYSPHAVAEHTVALLLTLNRRIHRAYNRVREHNFALHGLIGFDLHGKTAGVIGTGKIGRLVARILRGFGMEVIGFDPYPDTTWAEKEGVRYAHLDEVLASSDVISLHTPLTPETHHLLGEKAFARMKAGVWVVNTSRGRLIDTTALLSALRSGKVGGAALDVYEEEEGIFFEDLSDKPLDDDELNLLLAHPNVLVTSHQAFLTTEALQEIARVTVENIRRSEAGDYLEGTRLD